MNSKGVKINDLLECPVSSAPIFQCRNGHIVCKDCHPKLESCLICREANLYDTPMAIRNLKLEEIFKRRLSVQMDSKVVKINDLECPVCIETISSAPIFQCHNGHIVCKDCHQKLETCPICRDANLYDTPMTIRNLKLEEIFKRYLSVQMDSKVVKINDLLE